MFDQNEYRSAFSAVKASREVYLEVLNMKNRKKNHLLGKASRMILIGAAIVSMMAVSAFAYTGFVLYENPGNMMEAFFGKNGYDHVESETIVEDYGKYGISTWTTPEQEREDLNQALAEELVQPHVYAVGQSIFYENNTMTIEAFSYSTATKTGLVYLSIENPDGVSGYSLQPNGEVWWPGGELLYFNQGERYFIVKEHTTDTKLVAAAYIYRFREDEDLYMNFYRNVDWDALGNRIEHGAGIHLPLDSETEDMKHITLAEGNIVVSPIGITVFGRDLGLMNMTNETRVDELTIRYTDGTEYVVLGENVRNYAQGAMEQKPDGCVTFCLNRIVDVDAVASVVVEGMEYFVE